MNAKSPEIQPIANVVVTRDDGQVLFVKYQPDDERWWLPGEDLEPYEHPDAAAARVLGALPGLRFEGLEMREVESFRGRRGWHIMFDYVARGSGESAGSPAFAWFPPDALPRTMHGQWEVQRVARLTPARA